MMTSAYHEIEYIFAKLFHYVSKEVNKTSITFPDLFGDLSGFVCSFKSSFVPAK